MIRWSVSLLLFVVTLVAVHFSTLHLLPSLIMERAQATMEDRGIPMYQWVASPRQTPETQTVVRPSPDLSYAVCRFDVQDGPVLISAPGWEGYGSLSIFDERTNNVFVADLNGDSASIMLLHWHSKLERVAGVESVFMPNGKGLALIRRLAPNDALHERATDLVVDATCGPLK